MFGRENVLLWTASALITIVLRIALAPNFATDKEREFDAKLEFSGLSQSLMVVGEPAAIKVIASGSKDYLDQLDPGSVSAKVDLSFAKPGVRLYVVQVSGPTRSRVSLAPKSSRIRLDVQKVSSQEQVVEIEPSGLAPSGLVYEGAAALPDKVTVVGAESSLGRVQHVRALLELNLIRAGVPMMVPVEVLDEAMRPVPNVHAEPAEVSISPAVAVAPAQKRLLVTVNWVGQPVPGHKIESYEVKPTQVAVTGESGVLARLSTIETEAVNLAGLEQDQAVVAKLKLPPGVKLAGSAEVRVTLKIVDSGGISR